MTATLKTRAAQWLTAIATAYITLMTLLLYSGAAHGPLTASLSSLCLWVALSLFYRTALQRLNRRLFWVCFAGAAVFSFFQTIGDMLLRGFGLDFAAITFLGYLFLFFACLALLFSLAQARQTAPPQPPGHFGVALSRLLGAGAKQFWLVAGILFVCWLPYYVLNWPGLVGSDIKDQLASWLAGQVNAHHPIVHTAFFGLLAQLGQALWGSAAAGLGIATLVQMFLLALVLAAGFWFMARLSVGLWWRFGILLFYAVFPMFGLYAVTLWKDIWLAAFTLLFFLCLVALCRYGPAFFRSRKSVALLAVASLGLMLSKNNGIHMFALSLFAVLLFQKGTRLKTGIALLCGLAVWMLWEGPAYSLLGVQKGDVREVLSVPILQVAKVVRDAPESISPEDETLLRAVFPYDELGKLYDPRISDDIKNQFDSTVFRQNPRQYLGLWARLGLAKPGLYLHSFIEQTYGYWYPDVHYWIYATEPYTSHEDLASPPDIASSGQPFSIGARQLLDTKMQNLRGLPGFSMLQSIAFYFWLLAAAGLYALYTRKYWLLPPLVLFLAVWLVCLASPVYAEFRYAWPAIFVAPVALGLVAGQKQAKVE